MITKLRLSIPQADADTPVEVTSIYDDGRRAIVRFPDGTRSSVPAEVVHIHEPEQTIQYLAVALLLSYNTLIKAAREGRLMARKSGNTWLSTVTAVGFFRPSDRDSQSDQ